MIKYIKLKNHKALEIAQMSELGVINVICGKNNSGKTTVLEALANSNCYSIGKKVDSVDWLVELFKPQTEKYTDPHPNYSIDWFKKHLEELIEQNQIWFSDDFGEIVQNLKRSKKSNSYLSRYSDNIFDFEPMLKRYFEKSKNYFTSVFIPAKRQLEFQTNINLKNEITPVGNGIINRLFFLKNQDLDSEDYKVYRSIYDTFLRITGSKFNVVPTRDNQVVVVYNTNEHWIPASDSGLGLSDVLIIVTLLNTLDCNVFLLEEPENHLHAEYQKKVLDYLSSIKSKQFFITTHSPVFLDSNVVDRIFYCKNDGEITISDQTSKSEMIRSLGYSVTENLVADLIILLEGPTDIPVITEMLNWLGINALYNVKYWPLGGDIMGSLDLSVFAERENVFALIDSDPGSSTQRTRFMRNCKKHGVYCKQLERYSIENYFPMEAIRKAFPRQIPAKVKDLSSTKSVDAQIGFKAKSKTIKTKNAQIVENMDISDVEETDLYEFLVDIANFLGVLSEKG
jgi:AAA15 family ATPase/GTPase